MAAVAALLLLNVSLAFENLWPTPMIVPDHRIAPELVLLWCALLAVVALGGRIGPRTVGALALAWTAAVFGRYADVTIAGLFGRPLHLYWDGRQIPRFVSVLAQQLPDVPTLATAAAVALAALAGGWALYRLVRASLHAVVHDAVPFALRSPAALAATVVAALLVGANYAGAQATWPLVAKPVLPTYLRQASLLSTALSQERLDAALPASPAFDGDLAALRGSDVALVFLESYGAVVFDDAAMRERLAPRRQALARGVEAGGRRVVSAFVTSPTFAGASDLAHLGLLSGLDLSDPMRHDLLITSDRPTLVTHFRTRGYQTFGLYPAVSWAWPERAFYGFEHYLDGRDLGYEGPTLGFWRIPDQFAIARFERLHPVRPDSPPRLLFFPTITSHAPFHPVPPYQPDWERVLGPDPYDAAALARSLAGEADWLDLAPGFTGMIDYTYAWLADWVARPRARPETLVLLGDHQPSGGITGAGARWDVPVHVVSDDEALLQRLAARGFVPGLEPARAPVGALHALTTMLLEAFDGRVAAGSGAPSASAR